MLRAVLRAVCCATCWATWAGTTAPGGGTAGCRASAGMNGNFVALRCHVLGGIHLAGGGDGRVLAVHMHEGFIGNCLITRIRGLHSTCAKVP